MPPIDLDAARTKITEFLAKEAEQSARFGSALPGYQYCPEKYQCVIVEELEYDFGWVFHYAAKLFVETGDFSYALGGNVPLIVDRDDGQIYTAGPSSLPFDKYIEQYRSGIRRLAEA